MAITITECEVSTGSIIIYFSGAWSNLASPGAYTVYDPASTYFAQPTLLSSVPAAIKVAITPFGPTAAQIDFTPAVFSKGDTVVVTVKGLPAPATTATIAAVVDGKNELRVVNCVASTSNLLVYFSEHLDTTQINTGAGSDPNLTSSYIIMQGQTGVTVTSAEYDPFNKATFVELSPATPLLRGQWVSVLVQNVASKAGPITNGGNNTFSTRVGGDGAGGATRREIKETARSVEDAVAYPLLTEQVSFSGSGGGSGTALAMPARGASLDTRAALAVGDVLGWKLNDSDPRGFVGALTQAFSLTEVEGHTEATWNPRTYAVQTDLGGGITGAQASLYTRAKDAVQQSLQLLDGLYPLNPDADPEYVKALREMAKSQMNEILVQLGAMGGPSILRVNTYFEILLGQSRPTPPATSIQFDPDQVAGTLGSLRDTYGINFLNNRFSNSVEDEQNITNFRVISDYMTSLLQSWISNEQFFQLGTAAPAFFGTQLVLLSRQFSVIAETVNEVRFALESVFIGPAERQTLLLEFQDPSLPAMFVEDILEEVEDFVGDEGPRLLQDGGKISVRNNILPVLKKFRLLIRQAHKPKNLRKLPDGYRTVRVQRSLDDLHDQINTLIELITPVGQPIELPLQDSAAPFSIANISPHRAPFSMYQPTSATITIIGAGFQPGLAVSFQPSSMGAPAVVGLTPVFLSENLAAVTVAISGTASSVVPASYDMTVTNPDGTSALLPGGFTVDDSVYSVSPAAAGSMVGSSAAAQSNGGSAVKPEAIEQHVNATVAAAVQKENAGLLAQLEQKLSEHTSKLFQRVEQLEKKIRKD